MLLIGFICLVGFLLLLLGGWLFLFVCLSVCGFWCVAVVVVV